MGAGLWLGLLDATEAREALGPKARPGVEQLTVPAELG
jgi:hypothetical protein